MRYLLGEPVFKAQAPDQFKAPAGQQASLCAEVLAEGCNLPEIGNHLRTEYLAILHCLRQRMEVDLGLVIAHQDEIDLEVARTANELLGAQPVAFSAETNHSVAAFPRDMCVALPDGTILANPDWVSEIRGPAREDGTAIVSVLGEGGAVIIAGRAAVCAERRVFSGGGSLLIDDEHFGPLRKAGLVVIKLPLFGVVDYGNESRRSLIWSNNHIDRVCALLQDSDGQHHLVMDCSAVVAWYESPTARHFKPLFAPESMAIIRKRCEESGLIFHQAPRLRVPYSINLHQFHDGRVIMTGGDQALQNLVEKIVGAEQVFATETPIRYHPVWRFGGIRCLIGDAPTPLVKR